MSRLLTYKCSLCIQLEKFFFIMVVTDPEGRARERERESWMLGNFTFSLPGPGKLPVDCECSHLETSISTCFPFSFSFWFPFPGYCEPAFTGEEKPRKNLTQETCPDRESNPGLLRDRRACTVWPTAVVWGSAHSSTLPTSLHLRHRHFTYVTGISPTSPGEPPMIFNHAMKYIIRKICMIFNSRSTPVVPWLSYSPLDPRFAGSNPAGVDGFFQSVKILNMTSFGREVKPWVPCRIFTARKRTSSRN